MSTNMMPQPGMDLEASKAVGVIVAVTLLWVIGTIGVGFRVWARHRSKNGLWWDDWLVLFAWVFFTIICAANYVGVRYGAGRRMFWVLQFHPNWMVPFLKYIYAAEVLYAFIIGPIKCSICCLYIRLFGVHEYFRWYIYLLIVLSVLWTLAVIFGSVFQCHPVSEAWNPLSDRTMCIDLKLFLIGTNIANAAIDFLILVAPLPLIYKLRLTTRKKILIAGVLVLGAGETAFSIVRLAKMSSLGTTDMTWDYVSPIIWSTVEPSVGLLCACVPVMGILLPKSFMERVGGPSWRSDNCYYEQKPKSFSYALS